MTTPARTAVVAGAAPALPRARAAAAALAPDWRALFAAALAKEIDGRRFFLWIPVAAMAGVALNMAADGEPVLWLPALLTALCAALAWISRARPLALGLWVGLAALCAGFLSMGLRTARVETPVLDHVRIVKLRGFVEEVDIRPVGARLVLGVVDAGGMPAASRAAPRARDDAQDAQFRGGRLCRADRAALAACARGRCPAATISRATLTSRASARSVRRSGRSRCCRRRATPRGASAFSLRSIGRATAWLCASTPSSAATRARSPRRWSPASAISSRTTPRTSSARPAFFTSSPFPACR